MAKGKKRKGAKILGKYAASRSKRSRRLPIAARRAAVLGWLSFKSPKSILSAFSHSSILSFGSILSIGSTASILSIGGIGSILSIGSAGSILRACANRRVTFRTWRLFGQSNPRFVIH